MDDRRTGALEGKAAIVTGASRGIGRAIAQALADAGARVMLSSRKEADLARAVDEINGTDPVGEAAFHVANAGEPDQAAACVDAAMKTFGAVDILVNNAATNPYMGDLMGIDMAQAEKTVRVNQFGVVLWTQLAWKAWLSEHGGVIINISSVGGMIADPGIGYYNATKAAVIHLTRQLALELAPGVRVNGIAPGIVKTDMARAIWEPREAEFVARLPLKRLGQPEDIAGAAVFLASDAASWITGQTLVVDGGVLASPVA